jgi:transcriptional antiterminator NusG
VATDDEKKVENKEVREAPDAPAAASEPEAEAAGTTQTAEDRRKWYVVRVQSGREETVRKGLEKRIKDLKFEDRVFMVIVPKEKISEIKGRKKRVVDRKLYPGYIFVEMIFDQDTYHFIKETAGVGDFVGSRKAPVPMSEHEVERMLADQVQSADKDPAVKILFQVGDAVKINSGPFENFDGVVSEVNSQKGVVVVAVTIFGRSTPVELEYWQIERI